MMVERIECEVERDTTTTTTNEISLIVERSWKDNRLFVSNVVVVVSRVAIGRIVHHLFVLFLDFLSGCQVAN